MFPSTAPCQIKFCAEKGRLVEKGREFLLLEQHRLVLGIGEDNHRFSATPGDDLWATGHGCFDHFTKFVFGFLELPLSRHHVPPV